MTDNHSSRSPKDEGHRRYAAIDQRYGEKTRYHAQGTGVIAGGAVRSVLESLGVQDVLSKSQGSSNPHNVVKATFDALLRLRNANTIASQRGISLEKVFNG
jgi:ribosomal protein S5